MESSPSLHFLSFFKKTNFKVSFEIWKLKKKTTCLFQHLFPNHSLSSGLASFEPGFTSPKLARPLTRAGSKRGRPHRLLASAHSTFGMKL